MSNKVILIILDGLNYQVARECMGCLMGYVELSRAQLHKLVCELPSLSRPLYETILTGTRPLDHGVLSNDMARRSHQNSIFSLARDREKTTAAAAYYMFSELYNHGPFQPLEDRFQNSPDQLIQHGLFYWLDHYPDSHLFADAEYLRTAYDPDFLLIHPMNVDDAGHHHGLLSSEYRKAARSVDVQMAEYLSGWLEAGYQIMVTSDHGMNGMCSHGGTLAEEREVPLFLLGKTFDHLRSMQLKQLHICGLVCEALGIEQHGKLLPISSAH
ncbi:alkaline phosphatase family protein [Endozoicomonas arenosclerae]|uniref:alkaline phosphatase family protein n=1 Tax=Endozoicomonas arenosclerae TaxID=1633495 RepID=UPI000784CEA6|nr:alkaline phosphatase family protein [Endozoicomonas arenosclerae]